MRRRSYVPSLFEWTDEHTSWGADGRHCGEPDCDLRLVDEWTDEPTGPVITETIKRIKPGVYGRVEVLSGPTDMCASAVQVTIHPGSPVSPHLWLDASELRAAAATLTEIADALGEAK